MIKFIYIALIGAMLSFSQCGKKVEDPKTIIAGQNSKVWKAERETNSEGGKQKLSDAEKKEILQFYANGTFSVNGESSNAQGTWNYEEASKNLSLKFKDANVTENFNVVTLENDNIKLKASDGSLMTLASED